MASRWKYKTERVTVDENSVEVRGLTAGEREEFGKAQAAAKDAKAKGETPVNVARTIAGLAIIPALSPEELEAMPGDLFEAAVSKIIELSGLKSDEKKADPEPAT